MAGDESFLALILTLPSATVSVRILTTGKAGAAEDASFEKRLRARSSSSQYQNYGSDSASSRCAQLTMPVVVVDWIHSGRSSCSGNSNEDKTGNKHRNSTVRLSP